MSTQKVLFSTPEGPFSYDDERPLSVCRINPDGHSSLIILLAEEEFTKYSILRDTLNYIKDIESAIHFPESCYNADFKNPYQIIRNKLKDFDCTSIQDMITKYVAYRDIYFRKRAYLISCILADHSFDHWVVSPFDTGYRIVTFNGQPTERESSFESNINYLIDHYSSRPKGSLCVYHLSHLKRHHDGTLKYVHPIACFI